MTSQLSQHCSELYEAGCPASYAAGARKIELSLDRLANNAPGAENAAGNSNAFHTKAAEDH
jgi:hypothetical protein